MSVDISQLTARLDPERRDTIKKQYEERAVSPTAAFLLCFFLGSAGAHRFYLRQWRVAFAHLALFTLGAVALVAGLIQTVPLTTQLATHPGGLALDIAGVVLLLAALIWEIIDLSHIDHEVYHRNLLLAEGIIAGSLLADQTPVANAREKVGAVLHEAPAQIQPTPATEASLYGGGAGIITANEVADARALAEETGGYSAISYTAVSQFNASADPDQTQPDAHVAPAENWSETTSSAETLPNASADEAPLTVTETTTHTHTEDGARTTDSYETHRVAEPSAAEVAGLGAAALGAAALGAGLAGATHPAGFDEPTQPATPDMAAEPVAPVAEPDWGAYDLDEDDLGDVTDANMPAIVVPTSDIGVSGASPTYIHLPDEQAAPATPEEPEAPLSFIPDEQLGAESASAPAPMAEPLHEALASAAPPAEAYVPPVAAVYSGAPQAQAEPVPTWEQPTVTQAPPAAEPQPAQHDARAEVAGVVGVAGLAGAGALAAEALTHSDTPEPAAAPAPPKMKKIRVKRQVVLDGKVVDEIVVEREVPADMDTAEAAAKIQEELSHFTPEEIAQRAHLAPNEEVELHQRTEGPGSGQ